MLKAKAWDYLIDNGRSTILERDRADIPDTAIVITPTENLIYNVGDIILSPDGFYSVIQDKTETGYYLSQRGKQAKPSQSIECFFIAKENMDSNITSFNRVKAVKKHIVLNHDNLCILKQEYVRFIGDNLNESREDTKLNKQYFIADGRWGEVAGTLVKKTKTYMMFMEWAYNNSIGIRTTWLVDRVDHDKVVIQLRDAPQFQRNCYRCVERLLDWLPVYENIKYLYSND